MDPENEKAARDDSEETEVEDLDASDEEGSAVKGGITMRKAGKEQQEY